MDKLKKHIYDESNGLHYTLIGDYYIPDLKLPEENRSIVTGGCIGTISKRNTQHGTATLY